MKRSAEESTLAVATPCRGERSTDSDDQVALMPVRRGGGRGLKSVQTAHEMEKTKTTFSGDKEESKTKVKEQKLFNARTNDHLETKVITEDSRRKISKNGTTTVTSS